MQRFWKQAFDWKGISYKLQHPIVEAGTVFDLAADGVSEHMLKICKALLLGRLPKLHSFQIMLFIHGSSCPLQ